MTSHRFPSQRRLPLTALCLTVAGLLLVAACSPSSGGGATSGQPTATAQATPAGQPAAKPTTPAAGAAIDACSLLTKEEVEAAIGKAVDPVKETVGVDANVSSCSYQDPAHKPLRFVGLTVYALSPGQAKGIHEATKGGGRDQVSVAGIGEDAYWDKTFNTLNVLKGRYTVSLGVTANAADDPLKAAQTLAPKLLAMLP